MLLEYMSANLISLKCISDDLFQSFRFLNQSLNQTKQSKPIQAVELTHFRLLLTSQPSELSAVYHPLHGHQMFPQRHTACGVKLELDVFHLVFHQQFVGKKKGFSLIFIQRAGRVSAQRVSDKHCFQTALPRYPPS